MKFKMLRIYKTGWIVTLLLSVVLASGYLLAEQAKIDKFAPDLKGLSLLEHFWIHWTVGVFFGLLICLIYFLVWKQRLIEPWVINLTIFWSHFPDVRFVFRHQPHKSWEMIFFFHTVVDEVFWIIWVFLALTMALLLLYTHLIKKFKHI